MTTAVKRLKNGKACGEDNIINEMIRALSEDHLHMITQISRLIGIIKPIYKNKGDINEPDNYR